MVTLFAGMKAVLIGLLAGELDRGEGAGLDKRDLARPLIGQGMTPGGVAVLLTGLLESDCVTIEQGWIALTSKGREMAQKLLDEDPSAQEALDRAVEA